MLSIFFLPAIAQVKGKILDAKTKEELVGATISIVNTKTAEFAGLDGTYHLKNIPIGSYTISVQYIGYVKQSKRIEIGNSTTKWQTEGITFYNENDTHRIFISCETDGVTAGIFTSNSDEISLVGIEKYKSVGQIKVSYLPEGKIQIDCPSEITSVSLCNLLGQTISEEVNRITPYKIQIQRDASANFSFLKVEDKTGEVYFCKIIN